MPVANTGAPDMVRQPRRARLALPLRSLVGLALVSGMLSACGGPSYPPHEPITSPIVGPVPQAAPTPYDPVAQAAGTAPLGVDQTAVNTAGQTISFRVRRAYAAASGQECRELTQGYGADQRSIVICKNGQNWAAVPPLLRGGGGSI